MNVKMCVAATLLSLCAMGDSPYPINHDWAESVVADPTGGWNHYNPGNVPYTYEGWANDIGYLDTEEDIVLAFDHDILDDELNPYGLDFTVFISFYGKWKSGNTANGYIDTEDTDAVYDMYEDEYDYEDYWAVQVLVSYDGVTWFTCPVNATRANTAPIFGVPVDTNGNWSSTYCDFTLPINREAYASALSSANGELSVKELNALYKTSAGGISFDLKEFATGASGPKNNDGALAIRYIKLHLLTDTDKGYVAIAGASDVKPATFTIDRFDIRQDFVQMLGYSIPTKIGVFECSVPNGWCDDNLRLQYMTELNSTESTFLSYSIVETWETENGMTGVKLIAPLLTDKAAYFKLNYKMNRTRSGN